MAKYAPVGRTSYYGSTTSNSTCNSTCSEEGRRNNLHQSMHHAYAASKFQTVRTRLASKPPLRCRRRLLRIVYFTGWRQLQEVEFLVHVIQLSSHSGLSWQYPSTFSVFKKRYLASHRYRFNKTSSKTVVAKFTQCPAITETACSFSSALTMRSLNTCLPDDTTSITCSALDSLE